MPVPAAFAPLRHPVFRMLWVANLANNVGTWVQNTGAGWMMTSLDPSPVMVSLVQAATMLPVFLLALPAGALADIIDRRHYLLLAQAWVLGMGLLLAVLTVNGALGAWGLLLLTFGVGVGGALNFPGWAATTPELVPREDLVQAIALNGISFNLARAVGPALGGFAIAAAGPAAAFALDAVCFLVLLVALFVWRAPRLRRTTPREQFVTAMRVGLRFVVATPAMRAAILRACAFFLFTSAIWGLLPVVVRYRLGLGPEAFGLMLTAMGAGAVSAGFALPAIRARLNRGGVVFWGTLLGCAALVLLGQSRHWLPAGIAMALFGIAWISASSTLQASAQLACPPWVRARAIAIYQAAFFGMLALGALLWGWVGNTFGLPVALGTAGILGAVVATLVRGWSIDHAVAPAAPASPVVARPEAPAVELVALLGEHSGRVLEVVRYELDPAERTPFLALMDEVRRVRQRSGAIVWRLYEDVAHPERWVELWAVGSWTEHLREATRLTDGDHATLARAAALHRGEGPPEAARYINVVP